MIIRRQRLYSKMNKLMIDKIVAKLDKSGYEDYDVATRIPGDSISVSDSLDALKIYLPKEYEYCQYDIDDFLRSLAGYIRTQTRLDRNIYVMTVSGKLTEDQYCKLLKYIIDETEFVVIVSEEEI